MEELWLQPDELKFHTDDDISDVSEIWSEYGDEVPESSQPKMVRWNPARKNIAAAIGATIAASTVWLSRIVK